MFSSHLTTQLTTISRFIILANLSVIYLTFTHRGIFQDLKGHYLDWAFTEKTPGHVFLLCHRLLLLLRLLGSHAPESDWDVQGRLETGFKVHPVLLLEPAGRQRQPVPWRHPQHVGEDAPVELQTRLFPGAPGDMGESPGGVGVLPRPLKLIQMKHDDS